MKMISRAQLLRGKWGGGQGDHNPPWALPAAGFAATCDGCGDCVQVCPQSILKISRGGLPRVDFKLGECTFCGECADVCPTRALDRNGSGSLQPWQASMEISSECLAVNGTTCERCAECCSTGAIEAKPALWGRQQINVVNSRCNGCGACIAGCPVDAISIRLSSSRVSPKADPRRRAQ